MSVTIRNTLTTPDGRPVIGATVKVQLIASASGTVPGYTTTTSIGYPVTVVTDNTGLWSAALTPNSTISPDGTYYQVNEAGYLSTCIVPASGGPYNLLSILTGSPTPPTTQYIPVSAEGIADGVATLDGTGNVPLDQLGNVPGGQAASVTVVTETSYGQASTAGVAAAYSRGDHTHGSPSLTSSAPTTSAVGDTATVGTGTAPARSDHLHGREAFGAVTAATSYGIASANGSATTVPHSDHTHGTPALTSTAPTTSAVGDVAAVGTGTSPARSDHLHGRESFGTVTAQTTFGASSANGSAATLARSDHAHGTPSLPNTLLIQVAPPSGVAATDTTTIQTALDTAVTAGGGIVQLQPGTYLIQAPGTASSGGVRAGNNTTLAGYGIGVTTLQVVAGTSAAITGVVRTPNGQQNSKVTVRDLTIDGNQANCTGTPAVIGFFAGVTPNSTLTDTDVALIRVEIMNCYQYGFDPHERVTRLYMLGCIAHDNGVDAAHDGFTIDGCYDFRIVDCVSYNNGRHGINLVTASARGTVIGCESYSNGGSGIVLQNGAKDNVIIGNTVRNNSTDGIVVNGVPQSGEQDNTPGTNNEISGNLVELSGVHGIHLVAASGMVVVGNTVRDSSQTTNNTGIQIYLDESGTTYSTFNTVEANDLGVTAGVANAPKYGVREKTTNEDNNFVITNRSQGAQTAQISLLGTTSLALAAHNGVNEHVSLTSSAPATTEAIGTAAAVGVGTTSARTDHVHPMSAAGAPVASAVGDTQATGVATTFAASDHRHAREAFGNVTALSAFNTASANGSATTVSHSDHVHGAPAVAASDVASGTLATARLPVTHLVNLVSGAWYSMPDTGASGTITGLTDQQAFLLPLDIQTNCTLAGLLVEISTQDANGVIRFGLASDSGGKPGSWLNDFSTAVATSVALIQPASTPSVALTAGTRYWVGIVPQGITSGLVLRSRSTNDPRIPLTASTAPTSLNANRNAYLSTGWSGALTGAISVSATSGAGPHIAAKLT